MSETTVTPPTEELGTKTVKANEKKWGKPLMDAGWSAIPNILIEKQAALGLDAVDFNIIVHLQSYWWTADKHPHPSIGTIAKALNVTPRTVQRRIRRLEKGGLLTIEARQHASKGNNTNLYKFDGLIQAARPFAIEKNKAKAETAAAEEQRLNAKKPKIIQPQATTAMPTTAS
jgi:hypothetical protein